MRVMGVGSGLRCGGDAKEKRLFVFSTVHLPIKIATTPVYTSPNSSRFWTQPSPIYPSSVHWSRKVKEKSFGHLLTLTSCLDHTAWKFNFCVSVHHSIRLTFWRRNYFFLILTQPIYKMWIIQEPDMLELWNKLHFEEEKRRVYTMFKIFSTYICWINI